MDKVIIETNEVAWSGKVALKYQSVAKLGDRHIYGDPKKTEKQALTSLEEEVTKWYKASKEMFTEIKSRKLDEQNV